MQAGTRGPNAAEGFGAAENRKGARARGTSALLICVSALSLVGAFARNAEAQCAGGRVVTEETAGRCCWPGQRWSDEAGRCDGVPVCPAGMGGAGATCEPLQPPTPAAPPVTTYPVAAATPTQAPVFAASAPSGWEPTRTVETAPTWGLVATGTSMFFTGWLPLVVMGSLQLTSYGSCNGWGAANFVPLVGGAMSALGSDLCYSYYDGGAFFFYGVQYTASGVQILGFVLWLAGLLSRRSRPPLHAAEWELTPGITLRPSSAPGGTGVELRF